jgi:rhodanese-related sulfurtransferase
MKTNLRTVLFLISVTLIVSNHCALAHTNITAEQAKELINSTNDLTIVDVRERYEYCDAIGHIPGALNYPWNSGVLQARYEELPMHSPVLVVCRSGGRSNQAANFLDSKGFSMVYDMLGGMGAWIWETVPCKYSGGSGTANDPYQIATAEDLILLGETPEDYDKHFILTADIDLDPNLPGRKVFDRAIIAPDTNDVKFAFQGTDFAGVFDGNGHVISNLHIQGSGYLGLFGQLDYTAKISNLGLEMVYINGTGSDIGGLVGLNRCGDIATSYSTGTVSGKETVGGLVSSNGGNINMCYSTANVSGNGDVGGLVGFHSGRGSISSSFSTGTVTGDEYVGGLVGFNTGPVTNCYSNSMVDGRSHVGGLAGLNYIDGKIHNCFSTGRISGTSYIGGLIGMEEGIVTNSVWDIEASGQAGSDRCVGLTTAEMMNPYMLGLNGFANDPNWVLNPGLDYPRLIWEDTPGQIIPEPEIDWLEGDGTTEEPYRIITADQLILLGKASILWDKLFVLCADIDLDPNLPDGQVFGQAVIPKFTGIFDGNDHVINNLAIIGRSYLGLFGQLEYGAEVKDLRVIDVNITGLGGYVGSLAGLSNGDIFNCYSSGTVTGGEYVGGLVGINNWYGNITMSYSTGAVTGDWLVGGLVGNNGGKIIKCYSVVMVNGVGRVGGLVGGNGGGTTSGSITACYSTGSVIGDRFVGGLVGVNSYGGDGGDITNCYSTGVVIGNEDVGGLVGRNNSLGRITSSFWDIETSGPTGSDGGVGLTTAEMQMQSTFTNAGWDFENTWMICEGKDYPRLQWENVQCEE